MKPTDKYRAILDRQRKTFQDAFDKLFMSVEVILDSVDQAMVEKKEKKKPVDDSVELKLRK